MGDRMNESMKQIIGNMEKHNKHLSIFATKDEEAIRLNPINEDIRPPFFRDIDKVLYSLSYFRYADKTQVFSFQDNDMISKRMTHIQLVSKIARTIGRGLNLNEDLIEAAGLGHDLGHVPFGHVGEKILNKLSERYSEGYFYHNVQSVRTLMNIEGNGEGNNITIQVLDAILCHNGEKVLQIYEPKKKTSEEFLREYNDCYTNKEMLKNLTPMTLEGCVVRISDVVAYIGRDIEDAIRLGKITIEDLPISIKKILGNKNSEIINTIVLDIIKNSIGKNYIKISDNIYNSLQKLLDFNYKNIYLLSYSKEELKNIENMFNKLFELYYIQIINKETDEDIYKIYLNTMCDNYNENTTPARKVIDYIAGMTDNFFIQQYNKYFVECVNKE